MFGLLFGKLGSIHLKLFDGSMVLDVGSSFYVFCGNKSLGKSVEGSNFNKALLSRQKKKLRNIFVFNVDFWSFDSKSKF